MCVYMYVHVYNMYMYNVRVCLCVEFETVGILLPYYTLLNGAITTQLHGRLSLPSLANS